jgi:pseudouridine kinase
MKDREAASPRPRIAIIGGAVLDRKYHARRQLILETSNPVDGRRSFGGVARNVAENLARLGASVHFVSIVGDDDSGHSLVSHLRALGADVSQVTFSAERPTAEYVAVLDPRNDLFIGLANMELFDLLTPAWLEAAWPALASSGWLFTDCNPPAETLAALIARAKSGGIRLAINTVSSPKALRLPKDLSGVDLLFTNLGEAGAILDRAGRISAPEAAAGLHEAGAAQVIVTQGAKGYAVASAEGVVSGAAVPAQPVDITGAGDAFAAGALYRILAGESVLQAARSGALLAALTTESEMSVRPDLSPELLERAAGRMLT